MGCGTSTANGQDSVASLGDENKRPLSGTSQKEASEKEKALNGDTNHAPRIEGGEDVDEKSKLSGEEISDPDKTHSSLDSNCNNKKCDSLLENGVKKDNEGGNKRKDNEKEESQNKQGKVTELYSYQHSYCLVMMTVLHHTPQYSVSGDFVFISVLLHNLCQYQNMTSTTLHIFFQ